MVVVVEGNIIKNTMIDIGEDLGERGASQSEHPLKQQLKRTDH